MARGRRPNYDLPPDPQTLFITAVPAISLHRLSEMYAGRRGCGFQNLANRSTREGWVVERAEYQADLKLKALSMISDDSALDVVEASKKHVHMGRKVWLVAYELMDKYAAIDRNIKSGEDMNLGEAFRVVSQLAHRGVEIERKGLGLADKVVYYVASKEITLKYIEIIEQRLQAYPDLAADLIDGFRKHHEAEMVEIAKEIDLETMS